MNKATDNKLKETLDQNNTEIASLLSAIGNAQRLKIATALLEGPSQFNELRELTGLGKTALSHHLGTLVETTILESPERGVYELTEDGRSMVSAVGDSYTASMWREEQREKRRAELILQAYSKRSEQEMNELKVQIVELEPMRVASFRAVSESPESDSFQKLYAWAQKKGLLKDLKKHPIYGFNNPSPRKGEKEYGYEFWIKVDLGLQEEGMVFKDVPAERYAVTTGHSLKDIGRAWMSLVEWVKENGYKMGKAQCLEKHQSTEMDEAGLVLDLYQPIEE
ncbi:MAG: effector binding domain-containing protein [Candidatus Bathyarchaeota archaeon]|nr:effector binding domain-containing protein [Candidatus Bathyarchaeota archaeon]